jgi:hypothetical protein
MVTNQHKLSTSSCQRHENRWLCRLGSFVNQNTVKSHCIQDITSRPNAGATDNLSSLQRFHPFFKRHSSTAAAILIAAAAVPARVV